MICAALAEGQGPVFREVYVGPSGWRLAAGGCVAKCSQARAVQAPVPEGEPAHIPLASPPA